MGALDGSGGDHGVQAMGWGPRTLGSRGAQTSGALWFLGLDHAVRQLWKAWEWIRDPGACGRASGLFLPTSPSPEPQALLQCW